MAGISNFILLAGIKFPVKSKGVQRGFARPAVPAVGVAARQFTGGIPPLVVQGQRFFSDGFQKKHAKFDDNRGFRNSQNIDVQWKDRVTLAPSWSGTIFNTGKTGPVKLAKQPFKDVMVAYDTTSNAVWTKTGSNAWVLITSGAGEVTLKQNWAGGALWTTGPHVWGDTTTPTGWLSDCISAYWISNVLTPVLFIGSNKGHLIAYDGTSWSEITHAGTARPVGGTGQELYNGIYSMAHWRGVLHLGGQRSDSTGAVMTWGNSDKKATLVLNQKFGAGDINGASTVRLMATRFIDSDQNPEQLHFTADRTANGNEAWHFMTDVQRLHELRKWPDNYPVCLEEVDVVGARGLFFGMINFGSVWRYTGDYEEILRLDTPDNAYLLPVNSLHQAGRFLIAAMKDTTNGVSLLLYDGQAWWQGATPGSSYTGEMDSISVYRSNIFLVHHATTASRIFELNSGANYATSGSLETSLLDGDFPETPKKWLRIKAHHAPLATNQSVQVEVLADDAPVNQSLYFTEDFSDQAFIDLINTTAQYDPDTFASTPSTIYTPIGMAQSTTTSNTLSTSYYATADPAPITRTPAQLIAQGTAFSTSEKSNMAADDASATTTDGTGKVATLFKFKVPETAIDRVSLTAICYGADTTGTANKGITAYIWNTATLTWDSAWSSGTSTHTAGSADSDAARTLNPVMNTGSNYRTLDRFVQVLLVTTYTGTAGLNARLWVDLCRLNAYYNTTLVTARSGDVDIVSSGNIATATLTIAGATGGSTVSLFLSNDGALTWEAATSAVAHNFGSTGNALRWRVDMTAGSTTTQVYINAVYVNYVVPGWLSLGTNNNVGSVLTEYKIGSSSVPLIAKLISFRFTLAAAGTTTPQLFNYVADFTFAPDLRESFQCILGLDENTEYTPGGDQETRTPAQMYAQLLQIAQLHQTPSLTWVDGTIKTGVEIVDAYDYRQIGVGTEDDLEESREVPLRLVTVYD